MSPGEVGEREVGCAWVGAISRPDMVSVVTKYCSLQILCHTLEIIPDYLGNFVESKKLTKLQGVQEFSAKCANLWAQFKWASS